LPIASPSTSVTINGTPVPIIYTSANVMGVIVPYATVGRRRKSSLPAAY
jgi:uncharacterized protein (TIGR03437 family)